MSQPDNYSILTQTSTDGQIRINIPWAFTDISDLQIWTQNNDTGEVNESPIASTNEDETGVYAMISNQWPGISCTVNVERNTSKVQEYTLADGEDLDPVALVESLTKISRALQEIYVRANIQRIDSINPFEIPDKVARANRLLGFGPSGEAITITESPTANIQTAILAAGVLDSISLQDRLGVLNDGALKNVSMETLTRELGNGSPDVAAAIAAAAEKETPDDTDTMGLVSGGTLKQVLPANLGKKILPEVLLSWYDDLPSAFAAIGSTEVSLIVDQNVVLTGPITQPANIVLRPIMGSVIDLSAFDYSCNGQIVASKWRVFNTDSGGKVIFSYKAEVFPEWWNAFADGTNCTQQIQQCLTGLGLGAGGVVRLSGMYLINRVYVEYSNISIIGTGEGTGFQQTRTGITDNNTAGQVPAVGVIHVHPANYLQSPATTNTIDGILIKGVSIYGPYLTPVAYNAFALGIRADNVDGLDIVNCRFKYCGGENIAVGGSSNPHVENCNAIVNDIQHGGEVGIINCNSAMIAGNVIYDSYSQNGIGGNGINIQVLNNTIRNMAGGGMSLGGSGYENSTSDDIIIANNIITDTVGYPIFLSDDGAVTVPKLKTVLSNNVISRSSAAIGIAADYALSNSLVILQNNTITGIAGAGFALIDGSGTYLLKGNTIIGGGSQDRGVDDLSAEHTATMVLDGNVIYGHSLNDIQGPEDFIVVGNTLTGFEGNYGDVNISSGALIESIVSMTYSATPAIDASQGNYFRLSVTDATAYTIQTPTNDTPGQSIQIEIFNAHADAIDAGPFSAGYDTKATTDVLNPNEKIVIEFRCIAAGFWRESNRSVIH